MSKLSVFIERLSIYEKLNKDPPEKFNKMVSQFYFSIN